MSDKERLKYLLKYHANLCEQIKAVGNMNNLGAQNTFIQMREVEREINKLLMQEEKGNE